MSENQLEISKSGAPNESALAEIEPQPARAIAVIGPELARRLIRATSRVETLVRDGSNEFHHYRYPTIAQVREHANKALSDAGIALVPSIVRVARAERTSAQGKAIALTSVEIEIAVCSEDGLFIARWVGESEDTGDKGIQKATSAAMKYFLSNLLLMPVSESETDSERETQTRASKLARPTPHWSLNDQIRQRFWAKTHGELRLSNNEVYAALGCEHLNEFAGTMAEAFNRIEDWIRTQQAEDKAAEASDGAA